MFKEKGKEKWIVKRKILNRNRKKEIERKEKFRTIKK